MEETKQVQEQDVSEPKQPENNDNLVEFGGKSFDISTAEGKMQLKYWAEAFTSAYGKMGQKIGEYSKEVEPLRKFGIKKITPDKAAILKEVDALYSDGKHEDAIRRVFDYADQLTAQSEYQREKDRFWSEYRDSRQELFKSLDEDIAKTYVFANYEEKLFESDDPFALVDRVLKPKVKQTTPKEVKEEVGYATQKGRSAVPPAQLRTELPKEEAKKPVSMDDILKGIMIR